MEGSYSLIASPSKITSIADELKTQGAAIRGLSSEMTATVTSVSAAWDDENAKSYIQKFAELQANMDEINALIQKHANMLTIAAENYEHATSKTAGAVASLGQAGSTSEADGLAPPL